MSTKAIEAYLRNHYTDERLAALLAHAEDGKLAYTSCCCFIGASTADHALRGETNDYAQEAHYWTARTKTSWDLYDNIRDIGQFQSISDEEWEYMSLGSTDKQRREKIIPLIKAEIERRDKIQNYKNDLVEALSSE